MANHAFIDAQNLHLGIKELGWRLDYRRFRNYLRDKYEVERALLFIGYVEANKNLYDAMRRAQFDLVFKQVVHQSGRPKSNIDAELIVKAMVTVSDYSQAVLVTSDGDFEPLVK